METLNNFSQEKKAGDWLLEQTQDGSPEHTMLSRLRANSGNIEAMIRDGLIHYSCLQSMALKQAEALTGTSMTMSARIGAYYYRLSSFYKFMSEHYHRHAFEMFRLRPQQDWSIDLVEGFRVLSNEISQRSEEYEVVTEFIFEYEEIKKTLLETDKRDEFIAHQRKHNSMIRKLIVRGLQEITAGLPQYYQDPLAVLAENCYMVSVDAELAQYIKH